MDRRVKPGDDAWAGFAALALREGIRVSPRACPRYSTLAPENSTTFFHFAVSDAMILPKSSGVPPIGAPPRSAIRCWIFGSAKASAMSLLRVAMIAGGVRALTYMPNQALAS